ncbi:MAG: aldehyde dehydrogenase [Myxococcota bacterium]|nr:aldehyde dehydrogenase [Myxococcota bacterium]
MMQLFNMIGGEQMMPREMRFLENINPATGQRISHIPRSGLSDVDEAVGAAQVAFQVWSRMAPNARADVLDKVANRIEERQEEFALAESRDNGKPISLARQVDIPRAIANFRFFAGAVRHDSTGCHMMADALNYTIRKPLGVVGLITPWNLPLYLLSWKAAPALAMGNVVVAKPSEMTPTTASLLAEVFTEVGAPKGIFNVIHGLGAEAGGPLVDHPGIKAISFTGGTSTGATVAQTAAPQFKKLSLELGGKNASIVFDDCDFEKTVAGVTRAAFLNQGQVCLCGSRILVHRKVYLRFVDALVERARKMVIGDPFAEGTELGALISLEHRQKIESYIDYAVTDGGSVLTGGSRPMMSEEFVHGAWLKPTVIADLDVECRASTEEIFGPVAVVHPFDTEEEAIEIANGVEYGLAASMWTSNVTRAHRLSAQLDTGMVWVNTWLHRDLRVPFGGVKNSGVGREGGRFSLEFFSEQQNICVYLGE